MKIYTYFAGNKIVLLINEFKIGENEKAGKLCQRDIETMKGEIKTFYHICGRVMIAMRPTTIAGIVFRKAIFIS